MVSDQVTWGSTVIAYRYRFGEVKALSITVRPDLAVEVTAPCGTPLEHIRAKVCKRGAWIQKAWREFERFHPLQPPREYVPGETHRYLGRQYRLRAVGGHVAAVSLRRGYLEVTTPDLPTKGVLGALVRGWYVAQAGEILRARLTVCFRRAAIEGVPQPQMAIRRMANRWGSCTPMGRILLNPELIKAPKECIDYVITHELCHMVVYNHSPGFWRLLGRLMPDWEERRRQLSRFGDE